jgi:hypothetical protein
MSIAEVVAGLGVEARDGEEVVLTTIGLGGEVENWTLAECGQWPEAWEGNVYQGSGVFRRGSVTRHAGRKGANVVRTLWLPFDADLKDFMNQSTEDVLALDDATIERTIGYLREDMEEAFAALGLPIHRLDYTGHGLCAYVYLDEEAGRAVEHIPGLHKRLIRAINAKYRLVDPEVSDAGSRITRLPGSRNYKAVERGLGPARQTRTLYHRPGAAGVKLLGAIAKGESAPPPPTRVIPDHGKRLADEAAAKILDAVAPHWTLGQKHAVSLALAGMLAKAGVPEEQTLALIERLSAADTKPWDRERSVRDSYARVRSGLEIKGFYALRSYLPPETVAFVDGVLRPLREATSPTRLVEGQGARPEARGEFLPPPASAFHGWVGEYCDLVGPTTEAPVAFHLGVGLTIMGSLIGRHVGMGYDSSPLFGNLPTVLVGKTNTKKDTAIKRLTVPLLESVGPEETVLNHGVYIMRDVGSSTALVNDLDKYPNLLLYMTEFARLIGNARRKGSETILSTLMEAFDTPAAIQNKSMANNLEAKAPFMAMLAAVQPEILAGLMSGDDMVSGFANRLFFVCGAPTAPMPRPPRMDWAALRRMLSDLWGIRVSYREGQLLDLAPDAEAPWDEWYRANWDPKGIAPEEHGLRQRHHVFVQKLALLYAVSTGERVVSRANLERAIDVVGWMWANLSGLVGMWGRPIDGQIEQRVRDVLGAQGAMKRRALQMKSGSRKWSATDFARVFDAMKKNGTVIEDVGGVVALDTDGD